MMMKGANNTRFFVILAVVVLLFDAAVVVVTGLQADSCSVCGDATLKVTNPEAIFEFPGQPAVPCGVLEAAGEGGLIPQVECDALPALITNTCACSYSSIDPCQNDVNVTRCELEDLRVLRMQYLGDGNNCSESSNQQAIPSQFVCEDYDLPEDEVYLEVKDLSGDIQYYGDTVQKYQIVDIGDTFIMSSNINITIYKDSSKNQKLQSMQLSSDCDDGTKLFLGDIYGSLRLVGFGDQQNTIECANNVPPTLSPIQRDGDDDDDNDSYHGKKTMTRKSKKKENPSRSKDSKKKASSKKTKKDGKKEETGGNKKNKKGTSSPTMSPQPQDGDDDDDDNDSNGKKKKKRSKKEDSPSRSKDNNITAKKSKKKKSSTKKDGKKEKGFAESY
mmetsp:Transcript_39401/g.44898  ORF Transcript_39401/g.44898 Transcript_39401/m.44898 type:complete len:388 (-) Transcript_39401:236-1399(-)